MRRVVVGERREVWRVRPRWTACPLEQSLVVARVESMVMLGVV